MQGTPDNEPCPFCARRKTPEGHDGCLGELPDPAIMNACCGHGDIEDAYIQYWPDGEFARDHDHSTNRRLAGQGAVDEMNRLLGGAPWGPKKSEEV